jgi:hypothetical protein
MTEVAKKNRGQETAEDIKALLQARTPLLWIVTTEEQRVERLLFEAGRAATYNTLFWDNAQGVTTLTGERVQGVGDTDPVGMLAFIRNRDEANSYRSADSPASGRVLWVLRDLTPWVASNPFGFTTQRALRNLARWLPTQPRDKSQAIIVLTPSSQVPEELSGHVTVVQWPIPDRAEIQAILEATINSLPEELAKTAAPNGTKEAAIDAAIGLSGTEAQACYSKSLVQLRKIDPVLVAKEKKRVVSRERVLEWYDPLPGGLASVGGLDNLKDWLTKRAKAYSKNARAYGLPAPRGVFLAGIPGCGKSLIAKAIATVWGVPLLKLDLGGLKSKFLGESEGNLRKALAVINAVGRCVVWIDEIEKQLAGSTQDAGDGGVAADALGTVLTWMQERQGEAFVIATANDVSRLPPELMRKGRFDEIFFVDFPTATERVEILKASLAQYGRGKLEGLDVVAVAKEAVEFTGSEVAALIPEALYSAFGDGEREIATGDLLAAVNGAKASTLAKTSKEKLDALKAWAKGRAQPASRSEQLQASTGGNATVTLDI